MALTDDQFGGNEAERTNLVGMKLRGFILTKLVKEVTRKEPVHFVTRNFQEIELPETSSFATTPSFAFVSSQRWAALCAEV